MTKQEYAEKVAEIVGGEAKEVEKANGVKFMGVIKKDTAMCPTTYIDSYYENGTDIETAAKEVEKIIREARKVEFDTSVLSNWEWVKPRLRARLYNKKTSADIFRSAEKYGFEDLLIIPYITEVIENGSIKVTAAQAKIWGVDEDEIMKIAMENTAGEDYIQSLTEVMIDIMRSEGFPDEMLNDVRESYKETESDRMYVVTNKDKMFGAIQVILMRSELERRFPNGYIVFPSSVHEVIVTEYEEGHNEEFNSMVQAVNGECVNPYEVLGDKAYIIKKGDR